jgi:SagB-type dehydrogenase family enzyme
MQKPLADDEMVIAYHERTKHHYHRFASSLGYLDWETQPDPFRRYEGAEVIALPLPVPGATLPFDLLYRGGIAAAPLSIDTVSLLLRYALSITAWKQSGSSRWALRANPSSGNLHPTEAYLLLPEVAGLGAGIHHYAPREHALERRVSIVARWPSHVFCVGLSSIHWREAWKYGERAFRYCQHDLGHALGALRFAAAALGWSLRVLDGVSDEVAATLLGLDRAADFGSAEREEPELIALVDTHSGPRDDEAVELALSELARTFPAAAWRGRANVLSAEHVADWDVIDAVARASRRTTSGPLARADFADYPPAQTFPAAPEASAERVILGRRSAVAMDGRTSLPLDVFLGMLARLLPAKQNGRAPFDAIAWRPRIHLGLFVHRVVGLAPGLYALVRDPEKREVLQASMAPRFQWRSIESVGGLGLFLLEEGDVRRAAASISCGQEIAGDGAFCVAMLAEFSGALIEHGAWFYRRLFWEAGLIGQVLYLEAEAAGVRATGIGCYFDDPTHGVFGLRGVAIQSFYHFTVGGARDDQRLTTLPAYPEREAGA